MDSLKVLFCPYKTLSCRRQSICTVKKTSKHLHYKEQNLISFPSPLRASGPSPIPPPPPLPSTALHLFSQLRPQYNCLFILNPGIPRVAFSIFHILFTEPFIHTNFFCPAFHSQMRSPKPGITIQKKIHAAPPPPCLPFHPSPSSSLKLMSDPSQVLS